jgi:hypothetical protein
MLPCTDSTRCAACAHRAQELRGEVRQGNVHATTLIGQLWHTTREQNFKAKEISRLRQQVAGAKAQMDQLIRQLQASADTTGLGKASNLLSSLLTMDDLDSKIKVGAGWGLRGVWLCWYCGGVGGSGTGGLCRC